MSEPSPFSEFAQPKVSAVEAWQQRQQQERKQKGYQWRILSTVTFGSALGAGCATSWNLGLKALSYSCLVGVTGALVGAGFGLLTGAVTWTGMRLSRGRNRLPINSLEGTVTAGNSWSVLTFWMTIWGLIGIWLGASIGAIKGVELAGLPRSLDDLFAVGFLGSFVGLVAVGLAWLALYWQRGNRSAPS